MPSPFVELLADLAGALARVNAGWYLFGAQAALLHRSTRLTADVDITIHLRGTETSELVAALARAGFNLRVKGAGFVARTRVLPVVHVATGIPADLVLAGPGLKELFLERAEIRDIDGVKVPVARAEDIVVMKVLASRPKDLEDVVAILAARRGDFDVDLARRTLQIGRAV